MTLTEIGGTGAVTLANFIIDTAAGTVSGDLSGGPTDVVLFDVGSTVAGVQLLFGELLTDAFGLDEDTEFGIATISITTGDATVIPLPAGAPLLLAGFGALALFRRRAA